MADSIPDKRLKVGGVAIVVVLPIAEEIFAELAGEPVQVTLPKEALS
jgi:hypothetical protein